MANPFVGNLPLPAHEEGLASHTAKPVGILAAPVEPDILRVVKALFTPDREVGHYWVHIRLDDNNQVEKDEFILYQVRNPTETEMAQLNAIFRAAEEETHEGQSPASVTSKQAFNDFFSEVVTHLPPELAATLIAHRP